MEAFGDFPGEGFLVTLELAPFLPGEAGFERLEPHLRPHPRPLPQSSPYGDTYGLGEGRNILYAIGCATLRLLNQGRPGRKFGGGKGGGAFEIGETGTSRRCKRV